MKRIFFGLLAAAAAALPASGQAPGGAAESPALFFPEKSFEFSAVIDGASVVHDFVVQNKGAAPLLINNVRTG